MMSRSKRKTPIFGNTGDRSERLFKAFEHRRERRAVRNTLPGLDDAGLPAPKTYGNPWAGPKDGKRYWQRAGLKDMRK